MTVMCDACRSALAHPGGLLFSPPDAEGQVRKRHLCIECYDEIERLVDTR